MSIFNSFFDNIISRLKKSIFSPFLIRFRSIDHTEIEKSILNSSRTFLYKFNFEQLSFEPFFEVMRIFGRSPTLNVICSFSKILYFNYINPALGEMDVRARRLFCTKFNFE